MDYLLVGPDLVRHPELGLNLINLGQVDGFGSGGGVEVENLRAALEQSEKKAHLRDKLSLVYNMNQSHSARRLQLEQSEKEKANLWDKLDMVFKLYETRRVCVEEERALLKAELRS
ncbi:hypothetical protein AgCh_027567 [Apium graveolens]